MFNYLDNELKPLDLNSSFGKWCQEKYHQFSSMLGEIFSEISEKIHNAEFEEGDDIPVEYTILDKPAYNKCIDILMLNYKSSHVSSSN